MPAIIAPALPSLSQIRAWDVTHLEQAARDWAATAEHWDQAFESVQRETMSPGGTAWEGWVAEAAQDRVSADVVKVRGLTFVLYEASGVARRGAETLYFAKQHVLDAVDDAERAGYIVGEDLSVTPANPGFLGEVQAREYATDIAHHAAQLAAYDQEIATNIVNTTAPLHEVSFEEPGGPADNQHGDVRLVDNTTPLPEAPGQPFPEAPWQYNLDFTSDILLEGGPMTAGQVSSIDDAWRELHRCFNCNFPIGRAPRDFPKVGQELPLEVKVGGVARPFPVKVTQVEKTADQINIEFLTLPGHFDGPGSTIHFTFLEQGSQLRLKTNGYIMGGPSAALPGTLGAPLREFYTLTAQQIWQPYIDRLTYNIAKAKGYGYAMVPP